MLEEERTAKKQKTHMGISKLTTHAIFDCRITTDLSTTLHQMCDGIKAGFAKGVVPNLPEHAIE